MYSLRQANLPQSNEREPNPSQPNERGPIRQGILRFLGAGAVGFIASGAHLTLTTGRTPSEILANPPIENPTTVGVEAGIAFTLLRFAAQGGLFKNNRLGTAIGAATGVISTIAAEKASFPDGVLLPIGLLFAAGSVLSKYIGEAGRYVTTAQVAGTFAFAAAAKDLADKPLPHIAVAIGGMVLGATAVAAVDKITNRREERQERGGISLLDRIRGNNRTNNNARIKDISQSSDNDSFGAEDEDEDLKEEEAIPTRTILSQPNNNNKRSKLAPTPARTLERNNSPRQTEAPPISQELNERLLIAEDGYSLAKLLDAFYDAVDFRKDFDFAKSAAITLLQALNQEIEDHDRLVVEFGSEYDFEYCVHLGRHAQNIVESSKAIANEIRQKAEYKELTSIRPGATKQKDRLRARLDHELKVLKDETALAIMELSEKGDVTEIPTPRINLKRRQTQFGYFASVAVFQHLENLQRSPEKQNSYSESNASALIDQLICENSELPGFNLSMKEQEKSAAFRYGNMISRHLNLLQKRLDQIESDSQFPSFGLRAKDVPRDVRAEFERKKQTKINRAIKATYRNIMEDHNKLLEAN